MQTFLPYADFTRSAQALDNKRLGKQRVEAQQILNTLERKEGGWIHHPAVRMWWGYEQALILYRNAMIAEWVRRGFRNTMNVVSLEGAVPLPFWLGNEEFHASHRSNLLRKDSEFYGKFGWKETPTLKYVWPKGEI